MPLFPPVFNSGPYLSWTPTMTGVTLGTLNYANYIQIGKFVHYRFLYTLAGANITGRVFFTPPVAARSGLYSTDSMLFGISSLLDSGIALYNGGIKFSTTTSFEVKTILTSGTYQGYGDVTATTPFTWGAGDSMLVEGIYECA